MSIALTKNAESQYQIKYIDIQPYYIRELVNKKEFIIRWILGSKILVDRIIKTLSTKTFKKHWALLGIAVE